MHHFNYALHHCVNRINLCHKPTPKPLKPTIWILLITIVQSVGKYVSSKTFRNRMIIILLGMRFASFRNGNKFLFLNPIQHNFLRVRLKKTGFALIITSPLKVYIWRFSLRSKFSLAPAVMKGGLLANLLLFFIYLYMVV